MRGARDLRSLRAQEDLLPSGQRADPGSGMHTHSAPVATLSRRLRNVEADPDRRGEPVLLAMLPERLLDRHGASERGTWIDEGHEDAVTGGAHDIALVRGHQRSKRLVVPSDQVPPRLVADDAGEVRRVHDVGEHEYPELARPGRRSGERFAHG